MNLFRLIKEDFANVKRNDPALRSTFELFFNYPGLWALLFYRIAHWFYQKGLRFIPRLISALGMFLTMVDIHPAAKFGRRVFIDHGVGVVIGETTIIGNDVLIYQQVTLGGVSTNQGKRHPTIENNVVLGAGAKILGNITIGENSKVGANSVVVKDVPSNSTAIGIPARVLKRGHDKNPLSHNKIPDVDKELFAYLLQRIEVLEEVLPKTKKEKVKEKDHDLEELYNNFIHSMD
ncbi:MAG: serine O-acetyltransferase [Sulfurovum sp.]|nr:serine O-acetyltransferase [Sulfurovum sp.]MCB4748666.1 serine O-acetyltransferase [Sulfurovum sp.]MCB4758457.1 serine O-acetyltransferase [Sulfurovum sp.]MCB4762480.1 serine O-acetyltransferase [Sulfurovum sp.]MCB4765491.1 serine O-acetyltransferase [Sulfurovum sp.]